MYAGAVAQLAALVVDLVDTNALRAGVKKKFPHDTALQLHHAEDARVAFLVLVALVAARTVGVDGAGGWQRARAGPGSGRQVLFGLGTLSSSSSKAPPYTRPGRSLSDGDDPGSSGSS